MREEILLSGKGWTLAHFPMDKGEEAGIQNPEYSGAGLQNITVPTEVQLVQGLSGLEIYRQLPEISLLNKKEWWFRRQVGVPPSMLGKRICLVFDGVDYFASVWLNGKFLGSHEGVYTGFSFDVTRLVRPGTGNFLAVKVTCPWVVKGRGTTEFLKGSFGMRWPGSTIVGTQPPFTLSSTWDCLPAGGNSVWTLGITRDVHLVATSAQSFEDLCVHTRAINPDGSAELTVTGTIWNEGPPGFATDLELEISPANFGGDPIRLTRLPLTLAKGKNIFTTATSIAGAHLWWSWDQGRPDLYRITGSLSSGDRLARRFGIRTIERKPDMSMLLNGRRLFVKGAWYPLGDIYSSRCTRAEYSADLQLMRDAGINLMVSYGVVEKPDFYDLCDEMGMLIQVQLPFNQPGLLNILKAEYPRRQIFIEWALSHCREIILSLRSHPCITLWCPYAEATWHEWWKDNEVIYAGLEAIAAELDPDAGYHRSFCDLGEGHIWTQYNPDRRAYLQHFDIAVPLLSEFGMPALTPWESMRHWLTPEEAWSPLNTQYPEWKNMPIDHVAYGFLAENEYKGLEALTRTANDLVDGDCRSAREFSTASQIYQAFIMRYSLATIRRRKYAPIQGARWWCFKDLWPGFGFGIVDSERQPKIGYYECKRGYAPLTVDLLLKGALEDQPSGTMIGQSEPETPLPGEAAGVTVWVSIDFHEAIPINVTLEVLDVQGRLLWTKTLSGDVPADASLALGRFDWRVPEVGKPTLFFLRARAQERGGMREAITTVPIKAVPRPGTTLSTDMPRLSRPCRVMLLGQRHYAGHLEAHLKALGATVDVIDEDQIGRLEELRRGDELRTTYDVLWLTGWESLWKILEDDMAEGIVRAVQDGMGFIHSGSGASFRGSNGVPYASCLDFTPLGSVLPVELHRGRNDFSPVLGKDVRIVSRGWTDTGIRARGINGFNEVEAREGTDTVMTVDGWPLLVTGQYGTGRTVAFMGSTPTNTTGLEALWMGLYGQMLDFLQSVPADNRWAAVGGESKPLMQLLKELPRTHLEVPAEMRASAAGGHARFQITLGKGENYARLVQLRLEWKGPQDEPLLETFSDNFLDLFPGESATIRAEIRWAAPLQKPVTGTLIIEGVNLDAIHIPFTVNASN